MSHVTTGGICVTDLSDVETALADFPGAELILDKDHFKWFGRFLNDWQNERAAVNKGFNPETFGQCEHVIHFEGVNYEIGLVLRPDGEPGYDLMYDVYGNGQQLEAAFGKGLVDLKASIGMCAAERVAMQQGWQADRQETEDGRKQLRVWR